EPYWHPNKPETSAFRIPKPRRAPEADPRDHVVRFKSSAEKTAVLMALKGSATYSFESMTLSFYADQSGDTLQWRRSLQPFTTLLRDHRINYRWRTPRTLQIKHDNQVHSISDLREATALLCPLGLPLEGLWPMAAPEPPVDKPRWDPAKTVPFITWGTGKKRVRGCHHMK
ncbi:Hypothetical predicted protein, partial [Pelobates cultripes]